MDKKTPTREEERVESNSLPHTALAASKTPHQSAPAHVPARRSSRVIIVVPVEVSGQDTNGEAFCREARTQVVNAHGALLILAAMGQIKPFIRLVNKRTRAEVECRVAYRKDRGNGTVELGVEFETPQTKFWGITFPPEDWSRADRKLPGTPSG